jgi:hypothetical protein
MDAAVRMFVVVWVAATRMCVTNRGQHRPSGKVLQGGERCTATDASAGTCG